MKNEKYFENVVVNNPKTTPFKNYYVENAPGIALILQQTACLRFVDLTSPEKVKVVVARVSTTTRITTVESQGGHVYVKLENLKKSVL